MGFLVDGGEFLIRQGFRWNLIINARRARAIGATGRQTAVKQVRSATQGILKNFVPFPLVVVQFLPDNDLQPFIHQLCVKNSILIGDLHGVGDASKNVDHHYRAVPGLDFHPCGQLVLLGKRLLEFCLHLAAGVVVIERGQERSQLPRVVLNSIQMVSVFVIAGVVGGGTLDLFIQFLFQLLVVGFGSPDVPVFCGVDGLPGYLRGAGEQNGTGRKR